MVTNSTSLFSVFMHGAGVADYAEFISRLSATLKEVLHGIGADLIFSKVIMPGMREVQFAKAQDRRVIGSMNDNISFAKFVLSNNVASPYDLSLRMKDYIHLSLRALYPVEAFLGMKTGGE
jgi:two-component SAPR family response regulator